MKAVHNPKNEAPLGKLWAVISVEADGTEGILAHAMGAMGMVPLVTGSERNLKAFEEIARENAQHAPDKRIAIAEFTRSSTRALE